MEEISFINFLGLGYSVHVYKINVTIDFPKLFLHTQTNLVVIIIL